MACMDDTWTCETLRLCGEKNDSLRATIVKRSNIKLNEAFLCSVRSEADVRSCHDGIGSIGDATRDRPPYTGLLLSKFFNLPV